jgi:hypothetical protein
MDMMRSIDVMSITTASGWGRNDPHLPARLLLVTEAIGEVHKQLRPPPQRKRQRPTLKGTPQSREHLLPAVSPVAFVACTFEHVLTP